MAKSKMDPVHIIQTLYNEELNSLNVHLTDLEIAMELSADDGDSVSTQCQMLQIKVEAGDILDCSKYKTICILGADSQIKAIMSDDSEHILTTLAAGQISTICAPKIKIVTACYVILQS